MVAQKIADGSFEAAETEVVVGVVEQRAREVVGFWISLFGQPINHWAGGVGEAHEFSSLVKAFARSVINRSAKNAMFQLGFNMNQHRVTAADDERDVGVKLLKLGARWVAGNPRRVEMRFVMMDADERFSQREGKGLPRFETDEQRGGQSRPLRGGDGIQLPGGHASLTQSGVRNRLEVP